MKGNTMKLQKQALNQIEAYNQLRYKEEKEKTMKKKIYEYMTIFFAIVGTLSMVAAVGAIESDQWLLGASAVSIGIGSYIMTLFSQQLYSEVK
jgi:predicted membrane channel-forming protein YqfA (hemolysin III family)